MAPLLQMFMSAVPAHRSIMVQNRRKVMRSVIAKDNVGAREKVAVMSTTSLRPSLGRSNRGHLPILDVDDHSRAIDPLLQRDVVGADLFI